MPKTLIASTADLSPPGPGAFEFKVTSGLKSWRMAQVLWVGVLFCEQALWVGGLWFLMNRFGATWTPTRPRTGWQHINCILARRPPTQADWFHVPFLFLFLHVRQVGFRNVDKEPGRVISIWGASKKDPMHTPGQQAGHDANGGAEGGFIVRRQLR